MQKRPLCLLFVLCVLLSSRALSAQSPAPKPAGISCTIRHSPMTDADIAFSHAEYAKAADLYRADIKSAGDDGERAHNSLVRSLIRSGKVSDADSEARTWAAKSPTDGWALDAVAQVHFRKADIDKAGDAMRAALAANFCIAQTHADYSEYLAFTGYNASAKSQIEIAHKLDPVDDEIGSTWIHYQPRAARLESVKVYLERSKFLTEKERKSWERERDALSKPPAFPCRLEKPVESTSIPFHAIREKNQTNGQQSQAEWGLVVSFDGKSRRLEIDTGAHGLVLKPSAAAALGLEVQAHTESYGLGDSGAIPTSIARVKDLKIGGLEFHDCAVEILDKNPRVENGVDSFSVMEAEDGLIGGDVFQNFLLTLDFPGHVVKIDPLPAIPGRTAKDNDSAIHTGVDSDDVLQDRYVAPSMASWTKVFRDGHLMIVPVRLNKSGIHLFGIDTGAGFSMMSISTAKEIGKLGTAPPLFFSGLSGEVKNVYTSVPATLDFAGLRQPTDGMVAMDSMLQSGSGPEISGLLGQETLHQLTIVIDYRDQLMKFSFDPSRITHCVQGVTLDDCY